MADSIFPDMNYTQAPDSNQASPPLSYGKELAFDFEAGKFVMENGQPKVVEGIEALQMWIQKALLTPRYRYPIYSFNYGSEIEEIIGADIPHPVLESEVQRMIREALIYDDRIRDVGNFTINRSGDHLAVTFQVVTALGEAIEVTANV